VDGTLDLLAARAPGRHGARVGLGEGAFVIVDGTVILPDKVAADDPHSSMQHRRHGMNVQLIARPDGTPLRFSRAPPGRTHDPTSPQPPAGGAPVRAHRIIRIRERQGVPILADLAHQGGGPWLTTGTTRKPRQEPTPTEKTVNRALAAARAPVERGVARPKSWRIFRRSRCSPNRMTSIAKAVLTLQRQRRRSSLSHPRP
jgi:hypothetical protein